MITECPNKDCKDGVVGEGRRCLTCNGLKPYTIDNDEDSKKYVLVKHRYGEWVGHTLSNEELYIVYAEPPEVGMPAYEDIQEMARELLELRRQRIFKVSELIPSEVPPGFYWARFPEHSDSNWTVVSISYDHYSDQRAWIDCVGWECGVSGLIELGQMITR